MTQTQLIPGSSGIDPKRQDAKEAAVRLALKQEMALVTRNLQIVGIKSDGHEVVISESTSHDQRWFDALKALQKHDENVTTKFDQLQIYTDGGSRGNPGPSASGYVIYTTEDVVIEAGGEYLGITTNNQAEYQAVKLALEAASKYKAKEVDFFIDSLLVVNQMNGVFKIRNRDLWPVHEAIKELAKRFSKVTFTHVRREFNSAADAKVNEILDAHTGKPKSGRPKA